VKRFNAWHTGGDLAIAIGIVIVALLIGNFIIDGGRIPHDEIWLSIVGLAAASAFLAGGILSNFRRMN
jgi:hypothetical protein